MAIHHTRFNKCNDGGEAYFQNLITRYLDDSFHYWNNTTYGDEIDFMLLHPEFGLILIEVKDWSIKNITNVTGDMVSGPLYGKEPINKTNPHKHYFHIKNKLKNSLGKIPELLHTEGYHKNKLAVPINSIVYLHNISKSELQQKGYDGESKLNLSCTITSDEAQQVYEDDFVELLEEKLYRKFSTNLSDEQVQILIDEIGSTEKLNESELVASIVSDPEPIDELRLFFDKLSLNKEQSEAVNSTQRVTYVNAGPGTGKTYLLKARALKRAYFDKVNVTGLSFTNVAANNLQDEITKFCIGKKYYHGLKYIKASTVHSLGMYLLTKYYREQEMLFPYRVVDQEELNEIKKEFGSPEKTKAYLKENNLLGFEDILDLFVEYLDKGNFKEFAKNFIDELIIDEGQDLSKKQYDILFKLYSLHEDTTLFIVGDQRQNIYGWQGASFMHFIQTFEVPIEKTLNLKYTYRCPQSVLDMVNEFEFSDCQNPTLESKLEVNTPITFHLCLNHQEEAKWIVQKIKSSGIQPSDIAILAVKADLLKFVASELNTNQIAYKQFGGSRRMLGSIKLLLDTVRAISLKDKYSLFKIAKAIDINLKFDESLTKISYELPETKMVVPLAIIKFIEENLDKENSLIKLYESYINVFKDNAIYPDVELLEQFVELMIKKGNEKLSSLRNLSLDPDFDKFYRKPIPQSKEKSNDDYITLTTIHSAKGLEWKHVFVIGVSEGLFPDWRSVYNDELKKFYVACSRTREQLYITSPGPNGPSKFILGPGGYAG